MPSLPKIPISLTLKTLQVTHRQLAKHHKKWCFFIKAPINTFQHDWQLSPQCINYATLAAIFTNSVSGKKKVLMSSGKGVFTFYISLGRFSCFVLFFKENPIPLVAAILVSVSQRTREPPCLQTRGQKLRPVSRLHSKNRQLQLVCTTLKMI